MADAKPAEIPSIDLSTATDEEKLDWVKARANAEEWYVAIGAMAQDMSLAGIPLKQDLLLLAMSDAMLGGERSVRGFVNGLTLAAVDREARSDG